jgi:aminoglycoside 2'-N-acetyltransferase I
VASVTPSDSPELSPERQVEVRALLDAAFGGDFSDEDWEHTLGGVHVLVTGEDDQVVGHAAVVPRTITIGEQELDAGYVEGVATDPARQRRGVATTAMREINQIIETFFAIGVLSTSHHGFYERVGWERWQGPSFVRDGDERIRTADEDDGIMVLRFGSSAEVDPTQPIMCENRPGDAW